MTELHDGNDTATRGSSRRTILKTAGHAAWAVPAISLATAAPALAATTTTSIALSGTHNAGVLGLVAGSLTGTVKETTTGSVSLVAGTTVTISFGVGLLTVLPSISGTGWSITSTLLNLVNLGSLTLTYSPAIAANGSSSTFTVGLPVSVNIGAPSASASATGSDGKSYTASLAYT